MYLTNHLFIKINNGRNKYVDKHFFKIITHMHTRARAQKIKVSYIFKNISLKTMPEYKSV